MNGRLIFEGINKAYDSMRAHRVLNENNSLNQVEQQIADAMRAAGTEASIVRDFTQSVTEISEPDKFVDQVTDWVINHRRALPSSVESQILDLVQQVLDIEEPMTPIPAMGEKSDVEYEMPKDSFPKAGESVERTKKFKGNGPENADNFKKTGEEKGKSVKKESVSINNCKAQDMKKSKTSFDKLFESVMDGEDELDALGIDPGADDSMGGGEEDDLDASEEQDLLQKVQDAIETLNLVVDILGGGGEEPGDEDEFGGEDEFGAEDEEDDSMNPFPEAVDAEYKQDPLTGPDHTSGKQPSDNKVKGKATSNVKKGPGNPKVTSDVSLNAGTKGHAITNPDPSSGKQPSDNKVKAQNKFFGD